MKLWSVSVDLDGLGCYAAIHGVQAPLSDAALRAVPEVALSRLLECFGGVRGTLFVIGREAQYGAPTLRAAAEAGHEIGSHSHAHDYALSRQSALAAAEDLRLAEEAIVAACGVRPRGFRAPGYTISKNLLQAVRERGYTYDSSLLPSPPYYALKALALGWYAIRRRKSESILGAPAQLFARRAPHWRERVRELPVATLPATRVPVIGTSVLGVGDALAARLSRGGFAGSPVAHFNLELHGIDALDQTDVPPDIARAQPGLKTPAREKLRRLRALLDMLAARAEACTLEDAALRLLPDAL